MGSAAWTAANTYTVQVPYDVLLVLKEIDMRRKQAHIRPNKTESVVGEEDVASSQSPPLPAKPVH